MSRRILVVILLVAIIAVLVAAGIWFGMNYKNGNSNNTSIYSAVYLNTGDIYFGRLSWFPSPHMTNVWYLQRNTLQGGQTQVGVAQLKNVFWGPMDEIYLNPGQITFWTKLRNDSQLIRAFDNPDNLNNPQQPQNQSTSPSK